MSDDVVLYAADGAIARVTMNRPKYRNAQNSAMTYALDDAFYRAAADDTVKVIVLSGAGDHFSAGHDIGTPERDIDRSFDRRAGLWWGHVGKPGGESRYAREQEVYLGMCRRWRELPKPLIAQVHGACIAGGLMLAWICDLIVAADDAFFADPVVRMGIPGVEYFAHPWVMGPRFAKEFLFLGERVSSERALALGMVNRVVPRESLADEVTGMATKIAAMPRLGLALTKKAVNQAEDAMGLQVGMDSVFGLHHLAHAHNAETGVDSLAGQDARSMRDARKAAESLWTMPPSGNWSRPGLPIICRRRWSGPAAQAGNTSWSPSGSRGSGLWARPAGSGSAGRSPTGAADCRGGSRRSSTRSTRGPARRGG
jgi:enoyl-CoA hydratase